MTETNNNRRTVICSEADIGLVNANLGLTVPAANWHDSDGRRYGACSYIAEHPVDEKSLPNLKVMIADPDMPLELRPDHVLIVKEGLINGFGCAGIAA